MVQRKMTGCTRDVVANCASTIRRHERCYSWKGLTQYAHRTKEASPLGLQYRRGKRSLPARRLRTSPDVHMSEASRQAASLPGSK